MRTGELARASGLDIETIRYYERAGLLPVPERAPNGYRRYGHSHVERLALIRHCRALDMRLADIRLLLDFIAAPDGDCSAVSRAVDAQLERVRARLRSLRALEKQLSVLRAQCKRPRKRRECGILHDLISAAHAESRLTEQRTTSQKKGHKRGPVALNVTSVEI